MRPSIRHGEPSATSTVHERLSDARADHVGRRMGNPRWIATKQRANLSAMRRRPSAIASSITPLSEVRRPPSKAPVTSLRETAGNENGRRLSSVMVSEAGATKREGWCQQPSYALSVRYATLASLKPRPS